MEWILYVVAIVGFFLWLASLDGPKERPGEYRLFAKNHWHRDNTQVGGVRMVNDCPAYTAGDSTVCQNRAPYSG